MIVSGDGGGHGSHPLFFLPPECWEVGVESREESVIKGDRIIETHLSTEGAEGFSVLFVN